MIKNLISTLALLSSCYTLIDLVAAIDGDSYNISSLSARLYDKAFRDIDSHLRRSVKSDSPRENLDYALDLYSTSLKTGLFKENDDFVKGLRIFLSLSLIDEKNRCSALSKLILEKNNDAIEWRGHPKVSRRFQPVQSAPRVDSVVNQLTHEYANNCL